MIIKNDLDYILPYGAEKTAIFTVSYDQTNDTKKSVALFYHYILLHYNYQV